MEKMHFQNLSLQNKVYESVLERTKLKLQKDENTDWRSFFVRYRRTYVLITYYIHIFFMGKEKNRIHINRKGDGFNDRVIDIKGG